MNYRGHGVRLLLPALIVGVLAIVALWRAAPSPDPQVGIGTSGEAPPGFAEGPLTRAVETLTMNAVGRQATLDHVVIREVTSPGTFWAGAIDEEPAFVALTPTATRARGVELQAGSEVTLVGVVRPAPDAGAAMTMWHIDAATANSVSHLGTYLEVTALR